MRAIEHRVRDAELATLVPGAPVQDGRGAASLLFRTEHTSVELVVAARGALLWLAVRARPLPTTVELRHAAVGCWRAGGSVCVVFGPLPHGLVSAVVTVGARRTSTTWTWV